MVDKTAERRDGERASDVRSVTFWFLSTAVVAAAVAQAFLAEVELIDPDTIQHMSAAANLLAGNGYASNIVYYDTQYDVGLMPAPQTVWPPGYAWLLAGAEAIGLPPAGVAIGIAILSYGFVALMMRFLARRTGVGSLVATGTALIWLLQTSGWYVVLAVYTEAFFIGATVLSALFLVQWVRQGKSKPAWLFAAGAAATVAILTRYSGVFWPLAVGIWFLLDIVRLRSPRLLLSALAFGALPAVTTIALMFRNFLLTGRLSGGQFETGEPLQWLDALRVTYWVTGPLLGSNEYVPTALVAVLILFFIAAAAWAYRQNTPGGPRDVQALSRRAALDLSLLYCAVLSAFLFYSALRVSATFLLYRYFLPITPFIYLILAVTADEMLRNASGRARGARRALTVLGASVILLPLAGQAWGLATDWPPMARLPAIEVVQKGLAERVDDQSTVAEVLESAHLAGRPILAHHEHRVALFAGGLIYGLPVQRYSRHIWSVERVRDLVVARGVAFVIFFPPAFDPDDPDNRNRLFFAALSRGESPPWLRPRYLSRRVHLYEVVQDRRTGAFRPCPDCYPDLPIPRIDSLDSLKVR